MATSSDKILLTIFLTFCFTSFFWVWLFHDTPEREYNRGRFEQKCDDANGYLDNGHCLKDKPEFILPAPK
jgi:hypothetical protein